jgi:protein-S-isoprenylcysteine O-methyltransferase Ste14
MAHSMDAELQMRGTTSCRPARVSSLVRAALNVLVVLLLLLLAISSYGRLIASHSLSSFGILTVNTVFLLLFVTRPTAKSETTSLPLWLLATAAVALPLLLRPAGTLGSASIGYGMQVGGLLMLMGSLLSLRRSFALVPGNRGVRQGGLYRVVRHPMYLSELTILLGVVVANPTTANLIVWLCECGLQLARARAEEDFLAADPLYRAYRERVRYRLMPGLL